MRGVLVLCIRDRHAPQGFAPQMPWTLLGLIYRLCGVTSGRDGLVHRCFCTSFALGKGSRHSIAQALTTIGNTARPSADSWSDTQRRKRCGRLVERARATWLALLAPILQRPASHLPRRDETRGCDIAGPASFETWVLRRGVDAEENSKCRIAWR